MAKIDRFQDEYFFLSNFFERPVTFDGITYQNNEAAFQAQKTLEATPHKARLTAWRRICLHLFRHLAQKFLAGRQPSGSDCASAPPALCGIALIRQSARRSRH